MTVADMIARLDPDDGGEIHGGHFIRNTATGGTVWVADSWRDQTDVGVFGEWQQRGSDYDFAGNTFTWNRHEAMLDIYAWFTT